ncbi:MAG: SIS domain-containing protein [Gemmatimonadetes bacterium]|nr:SIS domain-containing protein [Gemmatimonadota bacterium]
MVHGLTSELRQALGELADLAQEMAANDLAPMERYAEWALEAVTGGGKLIFCGNGGSAADAQHLAAEYVVRMEADRRALPALALTTDSSVLTAQANDHGYEHVFARQVEALAGPKDLLVLHSTSGNSPNLLLAAEAARAKGVRTVALLAKGGGALAERVDAAIVVPTDTTSRAQELHLTLGHAVCRFVEGRITAETAQSGRSRRIPEELQALRAREKTQTLFYRGLAARAEADGDGALVDRFNDLHADEQHHLSRLTARLLELGESPAELSRDMPTLPPPERWEEEARDREATEVAAYEAALAACTDDEETSRILAEILESENQHLAHLGGKWMPA